MRHINVRLDDHERHPTMTILASFMSLYKWRRLCRGEPMVRPMILVGRNLSPGELYANNEVYVTCDKLA